MRATGRLNSDSGISGRSAVARKGTRWPPLHEYRRAGRQSGFTGNNGPRQPRVKISWYEAEAYAAWRGGRLPTEAQWEWAARGLSAATKAGGAGAVRRTSVRHGVSGLAPNIARTHTGHGSCTRDRDWGTIGHQHETKQNFMWYSSVGCQRARIRCSDGKCLIH